MHLLPERDEGMNFWPAYSDLALVMVFLLMLFVLMQFVVNSQILTNEAMALTELEAQERRLVQLLTEKEQQQLEAHQLAVLLKQIRTQLEETRKQLEETRQQRDKAEAELALLRQAAVHNAAACDATTTQLMIDIERCATFLAEAKNKQTDFEARLALKTAAEQKVEEHQAEIDKLFSDEPGIQTIETDGNLQIFTFSADVLFRVDRANLSQEGKQLLERFGLVLLENATFYTRIEVEGHADEEPSQNFYRSGDFRADHGNWRLSSERAITVVQLFQRLGLAGEQLAVMGRSLYEPVNRGPFDNVDLRQKALAQNRRVQVRLFYSEKAQ